MRKRASRRATAAVALLALLLALLTLVRQTDPRHGNPFGDFSHLTLSAGCLIAGCNPYDAAALNHQAQAHHQRRPLVWTQVPVYPPSSLLLALPFAYLGWPAGALAFDCVSGLALGLLCVALVWRLQLAPGPAALILLTGLVCNPLVSALAFANPALCSVVLTGLACLTLLDASLHSHVLLRQLAWIALGIALALKPQLVAGPTLVLLCKPATRAAALRSCALSLLLLLLAIAAYRLRLGSFGFLATLRANLSSSLLPGSTSDSSPANPESFDFLNLQSTLSRLPRVSHAAAGVVAWLTTALLAAATCWLGWRSHALRRRPWTVIALGATIALMPVYHRGYDRVIALLLVPAAVEVAAWSKRAAWFYALSVCLWIANDTLLEHGLRRWHYKPQNPVEEMLICLILLFSLWSSRHLPQRTAPFAEVGSIAT